MSKRIRHSLSKFKKKCAGKIKHISEEHAGTYLDMQKDFKIRCLQTSDILPEVQLSIFIRLIQIVFEYMHPIVSGI